MWIFQQYVLNHLLYLTGPQTPCICFFLNEITAVFLIFFFHYTVLMYVNCSFPQERKRSQCSLVQPISPVMTLLPWSEGNALYQKNQPIYTVYQMFKSHCTTSIFNHILLGDLNMNMTYLNSPFFVTGPDFGPTYSI